MPNTPRISARTGQTGDAAVVAAWRRRFDSRALPDERLVRELERRGFRVRPTRPAG